MNFRSGECTEISLCQTSLLSQAVLKHVAGVQRFHFQEVCAWDQLCILPRMKKSMALFHITIFHVICINFKKKTSTCGSQVGHMWVTSGLLYGSVVMGQQCMTHFQPWLDDKHSSVPQLDVSMICELVISCHVMRLVNTLAPLM